MVVLPFCNPIACLFFLLSRKCACMTLCLGKSLILPAKLEKCHILILRLLLQAKGGSLAFLQVNPSSIQEYISDGKPPQTLLAYINADHEYVLFDPYGKETHELSVIHRDDLQASEESGRSSQV